MNRFEGLATPPAKTAPKGRMDVWLESLNDDERESVMAAVLNPAWGHVDLIRALIENGAPELGDRTFGTWRRKMGWRNA